MARKKLVATIIVSVVALLAAGMGVYAAFTNGLSTQQITYRDPKTEIAVRYPEEAVVQQLSEEDRKAGISLRLSEPVGQQPYLVTLRSESGLRAMASLTKTSIIDSLIRNSERALPLRFEGYKEESNRRYEHNGRNASEFIFTYDSPVPGERIKQRFVILVKDDDTAVYLAMQAKESDFNDLNVKTFNTIAESLGF